MMMGKWPVVAHSAFALMLSIPLTAANKPATRAAKDMTSAAALGRA